MNHRKTLRAIAMAVSGLLLSAPALADKPSWAGGGKGRGHDTAREAQFERDNLVVHPSEAGRFRNEPVATFNCPPGLAKKNNGCMPPGQAKKGWTVGQPLPPGVSWSAVPPGVLRELGAPPVGYRYVRVGNDVLLLSPGSAAVVDVVRSLGRG